MIGCCLNILSLSANTTNTANTYFPARKIETVIEKAKTYYGSRYKWGGEAYSGLDCSGLIVVSFRAAGIQIAHNSRLQAKDRRGREVEKDELQKGDLLFFSGGGYHIGHVALVTQVNRRGVKFIHSSSNNGGVSYNYLHESKWKNSFVKAKRFFMPLHEVAESKEEHQETNDDQELEIVYSFSENEFQIHIKENKEREEISKPPKVPLGQKIS